MHPKGKEYSQAIALSVNEKGNSPNLIASIEKALSFSGRTPLRIPTGIG